MEKLLENIGTLFGAIIVVVIIFNFVAFMLCGISNILDGDSVFKIMQNIKAYKIATFTGLCFGFFMGCYTIKKEV